MGLKINPLAFAPLMAAIYKVWHRTLRVTPVNERALEEVIAAGRPLVVALWHDELFVMPGHNRRYIKIDIGTVVSESRDGEFITRVLERLGFRPARGSSTRGGLRALVEARRLMRVHGTAMTITVDGPRGPRHQAKEGAVYLASRAKAVLLPIRAVYHRSKKFNSWDKFQIPWPFTRVTLVYGEPYEVPEGIEGEDLTRETAKLTEILDGLA